jgi:hypothetical protein
MPIYKVMRSVTLGPHHVPTGKTRHYLGSEPISPPSLLRIVQYEGDPGFYLLHFDADGNELTDTYHDSMDDALEQADWEFQIKPHEWELSADE